MNIHKPFHAPNILCREAIQIAEQELQRLEVENCFIIGCEFTPCRTIDGDEYPSQWLISVRLIGELSSLPSKHMYRDAATDLGMEEDWFATICVDATTGKVEAEVLRPT